MLAVFEAAAGQQHRQVHVRVRIRAAHWRAVKNHRAVEQRLVFFLRRGERGEETVQGIKLFLLVPAQFGQHLGAIAVMGDVVDHGRVDEERNDARGIGLERQLHHIKCEPRLGDEFLRVLDVVGRLGRDDGLGFVFPLFGAVHPLLQLADRSEVLIHARLIGLRERAVESLGLVTDKIQQASSLFQRLDVGLDFRGIALDEQFLEKLLRTFLGGNRCAAARVTERRAFIAHRGDERWVTRAVADLFGSELIERNPVSKPTALRMRCARDKTPLGRVRAGDTRMAHARENRHLIAMRFEAFQIRAWRVILARFVREKELRQDAHVRLDANHPARRGLARIGPEGRPHRIQKRQRDGNARSAQEGAAGER